MSALFSFLFIIGIVSLSFLIITSGNNSYLKKKWRNQLNGHAIIERFQSEQMRTILIEAGIPIKNQYINFLRYAIALLIIVVELISSLALDESFNKRVILLSIGTILITSPNRFAPLGIVLNQMKHRLMMKHDSELISFLKLYENNRLKSNSVKLDAFIVRTSGYFHHIRYQLLEMSERIVDQNIDSALNWWVDQYPSNHPFISDLRTIILTTESSEDQEIAKQYLQNQQHYLTKLSSDHYKRRWKFVADIASVFNAVPSLLAFLMIVVMVLSYVSIIRVNTYLLN